MVPWPAVSGLLTVRSAAPRAMRVTFQVAPRHQTTWKTMCLRATAMLSVTVVLRAKRSMQRLQERKSTLSVLVMLQQTTSTKCGIGSTMSTGRGYRPARWLMYRTGRPTQISWGSGLLSRTTMLWTMWPLTQKMQQHCHPSRMWSGSMRAASDEGHRLKRTLLTLKWPRLTVQRLPWRVKSHPPLKTAMRQQLTVQRLSLRVKFHAPNKTMLRQQLTVQ